MNTLKEAVEYVYNYIKDYDPENGKFLEQDELYGMMEEMLLESMEGILSEEDMENRVNSNDEGYLDKLLNERLGKKYSLLLKSMANDLLNEYVLYDEEDDK